MKQRENMTLSELMVHYLERSQVANGGHITAYPGNQVTVSVETVGGEGFAEYIKAKAWGEITGEPTVLLKLYGDSYYVLSHKTYKEICALLSRDLSKCEIATIPYHQSAAPGSYIHVTPSTMSTLKAKAWYEISPGLLKLFQVDTKYYAISLVAPKTISIRTFYERKTGKFATPDPRREIIWYGFADLEVA